MPRCLSVFDIGHGSEAEWVTHGYGVRPNGVVPARQNSASLPECFEGLTKQLSALGDVFLMLAPARVSIAQSQFEEAEENSMCWQSPCQCVGDTQLQGPCFICVSQRGRNYTSNSFCMWLKPCLPQLLMEKKNKTKTHHLEGCVYLAEHMSMTM